jgi:hypothetical protein
MMLTCRVAIYQIEILALPYAFLNASAPKIAKEVTICIYLMMPYELAVGLYLNLYSQSVSYSLR